MKILHVTAYHLSISTGGTEIYIDNLCQSLEKQNVRNEVLILDGCNGVTSQERVHRLPQTKGTSFTLVKEAVRETLEHLKPNLIFIHTSEGLEFLVAEVAKELKIPYFYFFHGQSWLCYQSDLKYRDKYVCKRLFNPIRCTFCMSSKQSLSSGVFKTFIADFFRLIHYKKSSWLDNYRMELKQEEFLVRNATKIICFTEKDRELFLCNSIADDKLAVIPQGLDSTRIQTCLAQAKRERTGPVRFGYIGRCSSIKGLDILVKAALQIPKDKAFYLDIYGCDFQSDYCKNMQNIAKDDERIAFNGKVPADEVIEKYGEFDVFCIPSRVFETGPLTLLEGVYSGCLVAGSNQIGQMDFLKEYGLLIEPNSPDAWKLFFLDSIENKEKIRNIRQQNFREIRSMESVAEQVLQLIS